MIPATGSCGIVQENTRNSWNIEAVFWTGIVRIFYGGFLSSSCAFWQEPTRNHRNYPELAVSGLGRSTWEQILSVHVCSFSFDIYFKKQEFVYCTIMILTIMMIVLNHN
jgi:hypothetical protein